MMCEVCGRQIIITINAGTGICCDRCRKIRDGEFSTDQAVAHLLAVAPGPALTPWEQKKFQKVLDGNRRVGKKSAAKYIAMRAEAANGKA